MQAIPNATGIDIYDRELLFASEITSAVAAKPAGSMPTAGDAWQKHQIGAAIKKASPFAFKMFCGYSTGTRGGYMPVESGFSHAGYEVEMTPYGTTAADKLIRETIDLFQRVK